VRRREDFFVISPSMTSISKTWATLGYGISGPSSTYKTAQDAATVVGAVKGEYAPILKAQVYVPSEGDQPE
jgi:hypothetical protein